MGYRDVLADLTFDRTTGGLTALWDFAGAGKAWGRADAASIARWIENAQVWEDRTRSATRDLMLEDAPSHSSGGARLREYLQHTGADIFDRLFLTPEELTSSARIHWNHAFGGTASLPAVRVVFEFKSHAAQELCRIPLEMIHCGQPGVVSGVSGPFVLSEPVSVVRRVDSAPGLASPELRVDRLPVRVAVFAPEPATLPPEWALDIDGEIAALSEALKPLGARVRITVLRGPDATFARLDEEAARHHVIHFIGHGDVNAHGVAELLLCGPHGGMEWRSTADVAQCLLGKTVRLVFLNGCRTAAIGAFACHFPAVVGMQLRISDDGAKAFARGFYTSLAQCGQLDDAMRQGRREIWRTATNPDAQSEYFIPVLYMQSDDGRLFRFRECRPGRRVIAALLLVLVLAGGGLAYWSYAQRAQEAHVSALPRSPAPPAAGQAPQAVSSGPAPPITEQPAPPPSDASPLEASVELWAPSTAVPGEHTVLTSESALSSGEKFQVALQLNRDAFVQLLLLDSQGELNRLWAGTWTLPLDQRLEGGVRHVLPDAKDGFVLDERQGTETVYVIVSEAPMTGLDASIERINARVLALRKGVSSVAPVQDARATVEEELGQHGRVVASGGFRHVAE